MGANPVPNNVGLIPADVRFAPLHRTAVSMVIRDDTLAVYKTRPARPQRAANSGDWHGRSNEADVINVKCPITVPVAAGQLSDGDLGFFYGLKRCGVLA